MKKKQILLTSAMATTLMSISACSSGDDWDGNVYADNDTQVCTDDVGIRIDDMWCDDDDGDGYVLFGGKKHKKKGWYYVSRGSPVPYYGDSTKDSKFRGSTVAAAGATYAKAPSTSNMTRSAAVSRGGFGSSSRSYGGGRS